MNTKLMTTDEYTANLEIIKGLFVDLDITDLSPDTINTKICEVQNNFNKAGRFAIDSINNLHLARTLVEANKLNRDMKRNSSLISAEISALKSSDMREAAAENAASGAAQDLRSAAEQKLMAEAYHESVLYVHGNLERSINVLREKIKLFQSMLYLDPSTHR